MLFIPIAVNSQLPSKPEQSKFANNGVQWLEKSSWKQILKKAKSENKDVFVDCYATWCSPCYKMEGEVLTKNSVYNLLNKYYVLVKLQLDSTIQDKPETKKKYPIANKIKKLYNVNVLPTFLFISNKGVALHKVQGYKGENEFCEEILKSREERTQFYTLLHHFMNNKMGYVQMPDLVKQLREFGDNDLADTVAKRYIGYLDKLNVKAFMTKQMLVFTANNIKLISPENRLIILCKQQPVLIDSIVERGGFSNKIINYMVNKVIVSPVVESDLSEPNWDSLTSVIKAKYGQDYVENNILKAKINWYSRNKSWNLFTKYLTILVDKSLPTTINHNDFMTWIQLNNNAWKIFQYSSDTTELMTAIKWVEIILNYNPNNYLVMDTKANLLYKLGKRADAITIQENALQIAKREKNGESRGYIPEFESHLQKMKIGSPTW